MWPIVVIVTLRVTTMWPIVVRWKSFYSDILTTLKLSGSTVYLHVFDKGLSLIFASN